MVKRELGGMVRGERGADVRMLATGVVYEDPWLRLRRDEIERRDGSRGTYTFVEKPDYAVVIPAEDDGFHLVEEYRYPIGRAHLVVPAGRLAVRSDRRPGRTRPARAQPGDRPAGRGSG